MKPNSDPIRRLFRLAQEAQPAPPPGELPYGFTTRVLARLNESLPESPWERFALGALPVSVAAALLCFIIPALTAPETRVPEDYQLAQTFVQTAIEP